MVDNPRDFQKNTAQARPQAQPAAPAAFLDELQPEHVKSEQLQEREVRKEREFVFEPGDVVKLKSGGPDMTVHSYQRLDRGAEGVMSEIQTLWHGENGELHHGHFAHKTDEDLERIFEKREHEDKDEVERF
jgi:uncharacterized protein YodC (DUF2158 family)